MTSQSLADAQRVASYGRGGAGKLAFPQFWPTNFLSVVEEYFKTSVELRSPRNREAGDISMRVNASTRIQSYL